MESDINKLRSKILKNREAGCKCGSGIKATPHYFAGTYIGSDCSKCWRKNDNAYWETIKD